MKRICGLTLIELLIAASIFSIIILSVYSAFQTGILSYHKIDSAFQVYQTARVVLNRMELDLKNSFIYNQRDSKFQGDKTSMDFFSLVDSFTGGESSLDLCCIKYELSEGILNRTCYKGLDVLKKDADVRGKELTSDAKEISFQYAFATNNPDKPYDWQDSWPKENDENQKKSLPLAVKIKLSLIQRDKRQEEQVVEFNKVVSLEGAASRE